MSDHSVTVASPIPTSIAGGPSLLVQAFLRCVATLHAVALSLSAALERGVRRLAHRLRDDRGQATTEYALVLLAAALVALLLVAWATAGGGAAKINRLFNRVIDAVVDRV